MTENKSLFSSNQIEFLKGAIAGAGGNEVFFEVNYNENREIEKISVLARGNSFAAPAIIRHLKPGDAVIHNHPSGDLTPSFADIEVASLLGNRGIGFFIINNDVSDIYEVVTNNPEFQIKMIDYAQVEKYFEPGGIFENNFEGYEIREGQIKMAHDTADAFNFGKTALIEAGTGIGKSMAYLLCAAIWAVNNKERILISTNTINLQEQLIYKDIPQLQKIFKPEFKAALVKGRNNYICKRKIDNLKNNNIQLKFMEEDPDEIDALIRWADRTKDGSLSDINFNVSLDLWEKFNSEGDECKGRKCKFYQGCFVNIARKNAAASDLLIVNHHLLMADIMLRNFLNIEKSVLPDYTKIIIDEAHHLEDVATSFFTRNITRYRLNKSLNRFHKYLKEGSESGLLPFIREKIRKHKGIPQKEVKRYENQYYPLIINAKTQLSEQFNDLINEFIEHLLKIENTEGSIQKTITSSFLHSDFYIKSVILKKTEKIQKDLIELTNNLNGLILILKEFDEKYKTDIEDQVLELTKLRGRLRDFSDDLYDILLTKEEDTNLVKWIEINKRKKSYTCKIATVPLNISEQLRKGVFEQFETAILTSATLATGGNFDFIKSRYGISDFQDRLIESIYISPFDYKTNMLMGIPLDIPYPNNKNFINETSGIIKHAVKLSQGKTFILFTSYQTLMETWDRINEGIEYTILKQGDIPRHRLLDNFKKDISSVLMGLDSFWEGVDVQGEALESIIIMRLPFKVPTEPVFIARAQEIEKKGGDSFRDYSVPLAVIKFKQGFGRLIRNKTDRGIILVLDKRIVEKQYGWYFIKSLPEIPIVQGSKEEVLFQIKRFFE